MNPSLSQLTLSSFARITAAIEARMLESIVGERIALDVEEHLNTGTPVEVYVRCTDGTTRVLNPRNDIRNHSPDGCNWGYSGSGPAQLALAVLAEYTGSARFASKYYQVFKFEVIAGVKSSRICLTATQLREWVLPKLRPFIESEFACLFNPDGSAAKLPTLGDFFDLEWKEDGSMVRVDYTVEIENPPKTSVPDIGEFYINQVFFGSLS